MRIGFDSNIKGRSGVELAHCSLVARPTRKECQLERDSSLGHKQSASREARSLSAWDGARGVAFSAMRRGADSRAPASTGKSSSK
eukprot:3594175-Pleurochrysis_carterae.AAC.2